MYNGIYIDYKLETINYYPTQSLLAEAITPVLKNVTQGRDAGCSDHMKCRSYLGCSGRMEVAKSLQGSYKG